MEVAAREIAGALVAVGVEPQDEQLALPLAHHLATPETLPIEIE